MAHKTTAPAAPAADAAALCAARSVTPPTAMTHSRVCVQDWLVVRLATTLPDAQAQDLELQAALRKVMPYGADSLINKFRELRDKLLADNDYVAQRAELLALHARAVLSVKKCHQFINGFHPFPGRRALRSTKRASQRA